MISIITALYKSDRYLPGYLRHLFRFIKGLSEKKIPFEIIFVPQHPTSLEKELLGKISGQSWCRIIESPIPSAYKAWNVGVGVAKGEMIGFWNVDDIRYAEAIPEIVDLIHQGADLVYSPFRIRRYLRIFNFFDLLVHIQKIDRQLPEFNESTKNEFRRSMLIGYFVFRKSLYERVGPFDEQFKICGDFDWAVRAAKTTDKFSRAKNLAASYRVDGRGLSAGWTPRHRAENNIVYIRHKILDKIDPDISLKDLMKEYDPTKIFFNSKKYPVDENGLIIRMSEEI